MFYLCAMDHAALIAGEWRRIFTVVQRAHLAQALHDRRQLLKNKIDFLFGIVRPETESCARVRQNDIDPIAPMTCEGSKEPEVQAEPEDAAIPFISKKSSRDSPSMKLKLTFKVFGSLRSASGWPFSLTSGTEFRMPCSSLSRRLRT